MRTTFQLGEIGGIKVRASASWFGFLLLMTLILAFYYFPSLPVYSTWGAGLYLSTALSVSLLFALSVLAHELAHALLIRHFGNKVTAVMLFFFGGVTLAEGEPQRPLHEFIVAIAGPIASTLLALGFFAASFPLGLDTAHPSPISIAAVMLGILNFAMGVFNLLPGLPLDGGKALRAIAWGLSHDPYKADRIAARGGQVVGGLIIIAGLILGSIWKDPVSAFFIAYVGWMLLQQARYIYRDMVGRRVMSSTPVRAAMMPLDNQVPPGLSLDEAVRRFIIGHTSLESRLQLVVGLGGTVMGLIAPADISRVPRELWASTTVGQKMNPIGPTISLAADISLLEALLAMDKARAALALVTDNGENVGLLDRPALASYVTREMALNLRGQQRGEPPRG
ncbi:MAG: hypothetical protein DLM69_07090 [Candidatus Chloroheliales bacterium]|nr:MAG: hypothetical protein DLM69_07090 [Chloroflexota bacterium]